MKFLKYCPPCAVGKVSAESFRQEKLTNEPVWRTSAKTRQPAKTKAAAPFLMTNRHQIPEEPSHTHIYIYLYIRVRGVRFAWRSFPNGLYQKKAKIDLGVS